MSDQLIVTLALLLTLAYALGIAIPSVRNVYDAAAAGKGPRHREPGIGRIAGKPTRSAHLALPATSIEKPRLALPAS